MISGGKRLARISAAFRHCLRSRAGNDHSAADRARSLVEPVSGTRRTIQLEGYRQTRIPIPVEAMKR